MSDYTAVLETIKDLAGNLATLHQQAVLDYTPIVDAIVRSPNPDVRHIERTLDGLLDFCGHEPALQLYKMLCRRYFLIDPTATVQYIYAYREMWDSEEGLQ